MNTRADRWAKIFIVHLTHRNVEKSDLSTDFLQTNICVLVYNNDMPYYLINCKILLFHKTFSRCTTKCTLRSCMPGAIQITTEKTIWNPVFFEVILAPRDGMILDLPSEQWMCSILLSKYRIKWSNWWFPNSFRNMFWKCFWKDTSYEAPYHTADKRNIPNRRN